MPQPKPKPSEIAAEAKRHYIPWIERQLPDRPAVSTLHSDSADIPITSDMKTAANWPRVAVSDGDPLDVALGWHEHNISQGCNEAIPVVNMANERRPGGDWESGLIAPEECFARRSNLVRALPTPWQHGTPSHYPIPQRGGLYSPSIVVFREGAESYTPYPTYKVLPVISVAPVRRPKLDESGTKYSFPQERELMKDKIRTILRIAAHWGHRNLCLGPFGVGPVFRNPVTEVAWMWRQLLFDEPEFRGFFCNVVFCIDKAQRGGENAGQTDFEVFQSVFSPASIFHTTYR